MAKTLSRPKRWAAQIADVRTAFDEMREAQDKLHAALCDLDGIADEYRDWLGNLPDSLQDSATAEKLQEIDQLDLNIEVDLGEYEEVIDAAENADLPLGFGRD